MSTKIFRSKTSLHYQLQRIAIRKLATKLLKEQQPLTPFLTTHIVTHSVMFNKEFSVLKSLDPTDLFIDLCAEMANIQAQRNVTHAIQLQEAHHKVDYYRTLLAQPRVSVVIQH